MCRPHLRTAISGFIFIHHLISVLTLARFEKEMGKPMRRLTDGLSTSAAASWQRASVPCALMASARGVSAVGSPFGGRCAHPPWIGTTTHQVGSRTPQVAAVSGRLHLDHEPCSQVVEPYGLLDKHRRCASAGHGSKRALCANMFWVQLHSVSSSLRKFGGAVAGAVVGGRLQGDGAHHLALQGRRA